MFQVLALRRRVGPTDTYLRVVSMFLELGYKRRAKIRLNVPDGEGMARRQLVMKRAYKDDPNTWLWTLQGELRADPSLGLTRAEVAVMGSLEVQIIYDADTDEVKSVSAIRV